MNLIKTKFKLLSKGRGALEPDTVVLVMDELNGISCVVDKNENIALVKNTDLSPLYMMEYDNNNDWVLGIPVIEVVLTDNKKKVIALCLVDELEIGIGVATCSDEDIFNVYYGAELALLRAKVDTMNNIERKLINIYH